MLCAFCKYGHECPYMTDEDMEHAVMDGGEEVYELIDKVRELLEQLKARIKEDFKMSKDFGFCVELGGCKGYEPAVRAEGFEVAWENEDTKLLQAMLLKLYELEAKCRSKVGVRVPFETYDSLFELFERFGITGKTPTIVSDN